MRDSMGGNLHFIEIKAPGGSTDLIAWSTGLALPVDDNAPFETDGTFVWCRRNTAGEIVKQFVPGGSYLNVDKRPMRPFARIPE